MFFKAKKRKPAVVVRPAWYRLTEKWWPDCFWVQVGMLAKERRVTMRQPERMAKLIAEVESSYGEYLLASWPWVRDMQRREQVRG
jgi:hypothetical protein